MSRRCSCSLCAFFKPQSLYELEKRDLWSQESLETFQPMRCSLSRCSPSQRISQAANERSESHWFAAEMQLGTFYVCVDLE